MSLTGVAAPAVVARTCRHSPASAALPLPLPGTIKSRQDAVDYLTWTFFIRRLLQNPSYYDLKSTEQEAVSSYLSALVEGVLVQLQDAGCLEVRRVEGAYLAD
jgi:hypothetical protein